MATTNMEEAANIAAEFISSLDNLPNEVQHLLAEIKHKEIRSQELLQDIQKKTSKYIRHGVAAGSAAISPKDSQIPQKVSDDFAEVDRLADEKIVLARRMVELLRRARARLDYDLSKVLVLQGELDPGMATTFAMTGRNPVLQINDSLRNAITFPEASPPPVATPPSGTGVSHKRRRPNSSVSAGPITLTAPAAAVLPARSRLSAQAHARVSTPLRATASMGPDEDAEGEDDIDEQGEEGGDPEDKELYCFCQKLSYGEMIACDNPDCPYQWFHLACVGLKSPLPDSWYCSECMKKVNGASSMGERSRKGRKK